MPQDIPFRASETLAFIPESLASIPDAPVFALRTPTHDDKRFQRRLMREKRIQTHDNSQIRAEILAGLKHLWSEEANERNVPIIQAYWDALDAFELQRKDDPDLVWDYDPDIEREVKVMTHRIAKAHEPVAVMLADNADFQEMLPSLYVATIVKSWTGLPCVPRVESGYLTLESAQDLGDALEAFERRHQKQYGLVPGTAGAELYLACIRRMALDEETEKNSASPSPSETTPPPSTEMTTSATGGKSPASARSKKTPATA